MFGKRINICRFALPTLLMCFGVYIVFLAPLWTRQSPTGIISNSDKISLLPSDRIPLPPPDDDYVRDCITNDVLGNVQRSRVSTKPFSHRSSASSQSELRNDSRASFQKIYLNKSWSAAQPSGPGSTVEFAARACQTLGVVIERVKRELDVERVRILDVPCGDMIWMAPCLERRPNDTEYTGYDIVPELIEEHRKRFVDHGRRGWKFESRDVVADGLDEAFDVIISRMMLQHFFYDDVFAFFDAVSRSGSRYLLTTSFPAFRSNVELRKVDEYRFRPLNLEAPPISLPPPTCYTKDGPNNDEASEHYLHLWSLPLRQVINCSEALSSASLRLSNSQQKYFACVQSFPANTTS